MGATDDDPARDVLRLRFPRSLGDRLLAREDEIDLSATSKGALRSLLRSVRPDSPDELVSGVRTWGDVFDWFGDALTAAGEHGGFGSAAAGSRVRLRPVLPQDTQALYVAATEPSQGFRWRFRGRTPSFDEFERTLFDAVLAQYIVESDVGTGIGMVTLYNADLANGHAWFAFLRMTSSSRVASSAMIEGAAHFIDQCFRTWNFRKIYVQTPEFNQYLIDGLVTSGIATVEGELHDHYFYDGRYWSDIYASIDAAVWNKQLSGWFDVVSPPDRPRAR
jgi:RimJ/RimL family protein N-acetyltransferase